MSPTELEYNPGSLRERLARSYESDRAFLVAVTLGLVFAITVFAAMVYLSETAPMPGLLDRLP